MKILIVKSHKKIEPLLSLAIGLKEKGHTVEICVPELDESGHKALENGIKVNIADIRGSIYTSDFFLKRYHDLLGVKGLAKMINEGNYDIVHFNLTRGRVLGRIAKAIVRKKIPSISTIHGPDFISRKNSYYELLTYKIDDGIVYISQSVKDYYESYIKKAIEKDNVVIYNGYQPDNVSYTPKLLHEILKEKKGTKFIGMIAYFYEGVKGHEAFLRAARRIIKEKTGVKMVLVGKDLYGLGNEEKIKNIAIDYGIEKDVIFMGERSDVLNIIDSLECLVLPSVVEEGMGMVLLEAMSRKKPVIGSRIGGIKEVISDGINGYLVEPNDDNQLARKIMSLIENKAQAMAMGEKGYEILIEKFSLKKMVNAYEHYYYKIIDNVSRQRG